MMFFDGKGSKKNWKRDTIGVRMPADPVLQYVQEQLDEPLLVSSVPVPGEDDDDDDDYDGDDDDLGGARGGGSSEGATKKKKKKSKSKGSGMQLDPTAAWWNAVDFIVESGERPHDGSTIFDLTGVEPALIREGIGPVDLIH